MGYGRPDPSFATEPIPVRQVDHRESGETMRVVICGGGVIGACTAYFLSRRGVEVIVVERTGLANAASGKAGGFLALDWCAGTPLDALARRSFQLHAALREECTHRDVGLFRDPHCPAYRVIHSLSEVGVLTSRRIVSRWSTDVATGVNIMSDWGKSPRRVRIHPPFTHKR